MEPIERTRIEIVDAAKTYGATTALHPTALVVEPGEVLALLGPSGCGKTTLLRLIAGLEAPDAGGRIVFGADDVTARPIETRGVGMVFQHYALFPQMSVAANIGYGLRIRGVAEAERKRVVGELIDLVRLTGLEARRPHELSGGQRQRVALARAVAIRPRVLLLDEPLTALDAKLKEALRDELADLLRRLGITAVHVTHDQHEALAIADRLAIMNAGRIVQTGSGEDLYRAPAHDFVAGFLGRVNRIARDAAARAAGVLRLGDWALPCPAACLNADAVLLRPEDVNIADADAEGASAIVTRRSFLGDRVRYTLALDAALALLAEAPRDHVARAGDRVRVQVAPGAFMPALA